MRISNTNPYFTPDNLIWYFLAEFSLSKFLSDPYRGDELKVGLLFQTMRELGMPLECVKNIAMLVTEFAKESSVHYKQEGLGSHARIRIFCQKKIIDAANAAHASSRPYHTEQAMEHSPLLLDIGTKMNGGWGCFLIERGRDDSSTDLSVGSWNSIDLYLYKEGQ
jgi:hypothetical protein